MYIEFDNPRTFAEDCRDVPRGEGESLVIFLARGHADQLPDIIGALNDAGLPFLGAVFPALIKDAQVIHEGAIVQAHPVIGAPAVLNIQSDDLGGLADLPALPASDSTPTCLVIADFSCVGVASLLTGLFNRFGNQVRYFGAGAGDGERTAKPVVFANTGASAGSALIAFIDRPSRIGLKHGWARIGAPIIATRTEGNVIHELDWEPAMDIYRNLVGDDVAKSLWNSDGHAAAKMYPIGISREGMEDVVRDPLVGQRADSKELMVLSDVPQNSVVHVLHGDADGLMAAADALGHELADTDGDGTCLIFDCFSRAMLLQDQIATELENLQNAINGAGKTRPIEGALALGEIASDGSRIPDFHNKTIAAAVFDAE